MIYKASLGSTDAPGSCCGSGLPSQPSTVSPPAGWGFTGRLQDGKMAEQKAESAWFFSLPSSANESIDVESGPRPSFSQTTDTNWQHVSWFRNQTSSLDLETHLDSFSRVCIGKRHMRDSAVIWCCVFHCISVNIKMSFFALNEAHPNLSDLSKCPQCNWSRFNVWSQLGNIRIQLDIQFIIKRRGYWDTEHILCIHRMNKQLWVHSAVKAGWWVKPLLGWLPLVVKPTSIPWTIAPHVLYEALVIQQQSLCILLVEKGCTVGLYHWVGVDQCPLWFSRLGKAAA